MSDESSTKNSAVHEAAGVWKMPNCYCDSWQKDASEYATCIGYASNFNLMMWIFMGEEDICMHCA